MQQKLSKLFKNLPESELAKDLEEKIMQSVRAEQKRQLKSRLYFVQLGFVVSTVSLVVAILIFGQTLVKSEFWNFVRLLFSDYQIIFSAWGDYLYSLVESFPAVEFSIVLIPVLGLLISAYYYYFSREQWNHYGHI